jgi:hypothetical protein
MRINKRDQVFTKDNLLLGRAQRLFHRVEDVRPGWKHYETYLLVESFTQGNSFYVPTDFISDRDPQSGDIRLTVTAGIVENNTWPRRPDFILHGEARQEELVEQQQDLPEAAAKQRATLA